MNLGGITQVVIYYRDGSRRVEVFEGFSGRNRAEEFADAVENFEWKDRLGIDKVEVV